MSRPAALSASTIAICLIVAIANVGNSIISPLLPTIKDQFGSSAAEVALMASGFGLGRLVMDLPAGYLTDRVSPSRMFAAGILVSGVSAALAAFSSSLPLLIVFRTGMGFGSAIMTTVALVMLVNRAKPNERGQVLAYYTSSNLFGAAFAPTIGGYLAALFDWRAVFLFCAITPLIAFPLNLLAEGHPAGANEAGPIGKPAHERKIAQPLPPSVEAAGIKWAAILVVYFAIFLSFFNRMGMQSAVLPLYGGLVLGLDPLTIGTILSFRAVFTILVTLPSGALADRIGRKELLIPGLLVIVVGNLYLLTGESVVIFTTSMFLISMGTLSSTVLSALVADLVPQRSIGKGMGMFRFTGDLGTVAGPFALGLIVDRSGFATSSVVAACMTLVAAIGCALLVPRRTSPARAGRARSIAS